MKRTLHGVVLAAGLLLPGLALLPQLASADGPTAHTFSPIQTTSSVGSAVRDLPTPTPSTGQMAGNIAHSTSAEQNLPCVAYALAPPCDFTAKANGQAFDLHWKKIGASEADSYELRAANHQDGTLLPINPVTGPVFGPSQWIIHIPGKSESYAALLNGPNLSQKAPGGIDFLLRACNASGECGSEAKAFVPVS